jgi:hypothetical protein
MASKKAAPTPTQAWRNPTFDEYDLEVNPEEFLVPAQDEKGHSAREWVRLQPALEADVEFILSSKVFPYRSKSDLLRHAIYRHIQWLHRCKESMPKHLLVAFEAILEVLRNEELNQRNEHVFEQLRSVMEGYLSHGDNGEAKRVLAIIRSKLRGVQDGPWKRRFLSKLDRSYTEKEQPAATEAAG